jgi:hypothetical protein
LAPVTLNAAKAAKELSMKRFILSLLVGALVLAVVPAIQAKGGSSKGGSGSKGSGNKGSNQQVHKDRDRNHDRDRDRRSDRDHDRYYLTHGTKASFGWYFKGKNHNHWSSWRWSSKYGCKCYFDRGCGSWFYFCVPDDCYYPVTYCPYGKYVFTTSVTTAGEDTIGEVAPD